jgi:DNA invertase Pin-like site-specific DNA recombinase
MFDLEENGHGIKTVVVEMVNRLARDLMVQEIIVRDFQKHGFELLSATEGEDLLSIDPTRKLVRQVLGAIAEYEKQMLVLKLKAARDRQRRIQGKCEGRKSWKERDPEILAEIKKLRRKRNGRRMSFRKIAGVLNEKGFKNSVGGSFTAKGLSSMWSRNC